LTNLLESTPLSSSRRERSVGTVKDANGALVLGASIVVKNLVRSLFGPSPESFSSDGCNIPFRCM
jgi:hypothetical protein